MASDVVKLPVSSLLTCPLIAQLGTFAQNWFDFTNPEQLLSYAPSLTTSAPDMKSFVKIMNSWPNASLIIIQGHRTNLSQANDPRSDTSRFQYEEPYIFGALLRHPWNRDLPTKPPVYYIGIEPYLLFQLSPVHRVYRECEPQTRPLHSPFSTRDDENVIVCGRKPSSIGSWEGSTSLEISSNLETAWFEHGKVDVQGVQGAGSQFEGFCPFGEGEEGRIQIHIERFEVWGSGTNWLSYKYQYYGNY